MNNLKMHLLAVVFLCVNSFAVNTANAQQEPYTSPGKLKNPAIEALQKQIDELKTQVDELSSQGAGDDSEQLGDTGSDNDFNLQLEWDPGPKLSSQDGQYTFQLNGRVVYDYASISYKDGEGNSRPEDKVTGPHVRQLEIGFRGKMFGNFGYRAVVKFTGGETELKMAFVDYTSGNTKVTFGHTRIFATLDKMTPPTMSVFAERFAFINAIRADRRIGIVAAQNGEDWSVSGGYFFADASNDKNNDDRIFSGRVNYSPRFDNGIGLHLGASAFYRNQSGGAYQLEYETRPLSKQGEIKPLFSGDFLVDNEQFIGGEFATTFKSLVFQAEYGTTKTNLNAIETQTMENPRYEGGYLEVGFFPTGASQEIDGSDGRWNRIKIKNPIGHGGIGEIKLAARLDLADLRHETFGSQQTSYIGAVDWYLNEAIKVQLNYAHSVIRNYLNVRTDIVDTINSRFLFNF